MTDETKKKQQAARHRENGGTQRENGEETTVRSSITGDAISRRFLEFYAARNHKIFPSSSLVPEYPIVLFTITGMLQFRPILLGQV